MRGEEGGGGGGGLIFPCHQAITVYLPLRPTPLIYIHTCTVTLSYAADGYFLPCYNWALASKVHHCKYKHVLYKNFVKKLLQLYFRTLWGIRKHFFKFKISFKTKSYTGFYCNCLYFHFQCEYLIARISYVKGGMRDGEGGWEMGRGDERWGGGMGDGEGG